MLSKTETAAALRQARSANPQGSQATSRKSFLNNCSDSSVNNNGSNGNITNSNEIKRSLRNHFLQKRELLNKNELADKSVQIAENLINHPIYKSSKTIALYSSSRSEADTSIIFERNAELGKKSCFPKVCENTLRFYEVSELSDLKPGKFGILEPIDTKSKEITPEKIDLFIIPAVCIDLSGNRIGYGMGYYDRALSNIDSGKKVGLVFELQITCTIPAEQFDKHVGHIATEAGVIKTSRGGN
ncbi:MAG: 5-formyltetrahydrofolate cyclo-ligase [Candidatus Dadabacteria bacterium]|nr:5-formyltetrahydrofolate cyclo-ligase [Candidatus Dadabacteria bacterium]NIS07571.1 5-formyltetrahydrofolate cyclo-ligase [Candidatus Dadabacteria bacterium]NIY21186.1 5-formyltetrahydrofolate cyclo-ligase [Candidatus Dadabacteria bacterium]